MEVQGFTGSAQKHWFEGTGHRIYPMLPLNLKDSKGNQVPVERKEIWGHCTAVPQPGTKSTNSQQCHMTQHRHLTVWEKSVCMQSSPGRVAGWNKVVKCGQRTAGQPHTPGRRGSKGPTEGSGPTLSALADRSLSCTTPAACSKGLYPRSTDAQSHSSHSQVSCF
jgi:hypothetical protein